MQFVCLFWFVGFVIACIAQAIEISENQYYNSETKEWEIKKKWSAFDLITDSVIWPLHIILTLSLRAINLYKQYQNDK